MNQEPLTPPRPPLRVILGAKRYMLKTDLDRQVKMGRDSFIFRQQQQNLQAKALKLREKELTLQQQEDALAASRSKCAQIANRLAGNAHREAVKATAALKEQRRKAAQEKQTAAVASRRRVAAIANRLLAANKVIREVAKERDAAFQMGYEMGKDAKEAESELEQDDCDIGFCSHCDGTQPIETVVLPCAHAFACFECLKDLQDAANYYGDTAERASTTRAAAQIARQRTQALFDPSAVSTGTLGPRCTICQEVFVSFQRFSFD